MDTIQINGLAVQVIRSSRRKTMAIKIQEDKVSLHLPKRMPLWLAKQFVSRKQEWIQRKLMHYQQRSPARQFTQGELQPFTGSRYPLNLLINNCQPAQLHFDQQHFTLTAPKGTEQQTYRELFICWYRQQAEALLSERTRQLSQQTGLVPGKIQIKSYKSRWGSCNIKGDIQLNWQLIQAPWHIIDYVIIHELCHLQHHNHSPAFWELVGSIDPNYPAHRAWLKQYGYQLVL